MNLFFFRRITPKSIGTTNVDVPPSNLHKQFAWQEKAAADASNSLGGFPLEQVGQRRALVGTEHEAASASRSLPDGLGDNALGVLHAAEAQLGSNVLQTDTRVGGTDASEARPQHVLPQPHHQVAGPVPGKHLGVHVCHVPVAPQSGIKELGDFTRVLSLCKLLLCRLALRAVQIDQQVCTGQGQGSSVPYCGARGSTD